MFQISAMLLCETIRTTDCKAVKIFKGWRSFIQNLLYYWLIKVCLESQSCIHLDYQKVCNSTYPQTPKSIACLSSFKLELSIYTSKSSTAYEMHIGQKAEYNQQKLTFAHKFICKVLRIRNEIGKKKLNGSTLYAKRV